MNRGERLGRGSLAVNAAFCTVVGIVLIGARRRIARLLGGRSIVAGIAGVATIGWAGIVVSQVVRPDWRAATARIAAANLAGMSALMVAASLHPRRRARFVLTGAAIDVAILAVVQLAALIIRGGDSEERTGD